MKNLNQLFFILLLLLIKIKVGYAQNATVITQYTHLNATSNIQFFDGDYFYYSDNYNFQQNNYLRRYNLDTKKDTIFQTLNFGCSTTQNFYTCNCIIQGSIVLNGNAYILMGSSFKKLNLSNFTWSNLQNYSASFTQWRAAMVSDGSNYIYVWGGFSGSCSSPTYSNQLWRYDIANDSWFLLSTAPSSALSKNAIYKYPYLYFGGGTECWDAIRTYNLINNTWGSISRPPLNQGPNPAINCNWVSNEKLFIENSSIYCIATDCINTCNFSLWKYDEISQIWSSQNLSNFNTNLNLGSWAPDNQGLIESFYNRGNIFYFTNNQFTLSANGGSCGGSGCDGQINALSMKRQINLIIDSTSCYSAIDDSLKIFYSIEYNGAYNSSNTNVYLSDANNLNPITLFTNSNFFSSNQTVQNKSKTIHKNYLNYYLRAYNYQGTDTIISTNKFPVNYKIRYVPSGSITANPSLTFCSGQPVGAVLTVTNSTGNTYQWYLNNSILAGQNLINYTATQVGTYYCVIKSTNGCSNSTTPATVQTIANPTATITSVGSNTFCQGSSIVLNASGSAGLTYQWKNNGTNISGATLSSYTATTTGNYAVAVANSSSCTANSNTINISVQASPTVAVSNATICSGNTANLTATGATTYSWNTGGTAASISVAPIATTNYTVNGTSNGCTNTKTVSVTVKGTPTVAVSNATICSGNTANLTATGATTYSWNTGAITSSISVSPTITTNYFVVGTNSLGCSNSKTISVTVNQLPIVTLGSIQSPLCVNNSTVSLLGTPLGGVFSGVGVIGASFNPAVSGTGTFTINYTYTNANNCSAIASQSVNVNLCTGLIELNSDTISIFPNPASTEITISTPVKFTDVKLVNSIGQIVGQTKYSNTVSVVELSSGIYFMQLFNENGNLLKVAKFVKE